jgi:hypothetical protein
MSVAPGSVGGSPDPAQAAIAGFIKETRFAFDVLLIATLGTGMFIPILVCLFVFSTERTRRSPMFIFVVTIVVLTLVDSIGNVVVQVNIIHNLSPSACSDNNKTASGTHSHKALQHWRIRTKDDSL